MEHTNHFPWIGGKKDVHPTTFEEIFPYRSNLPYDDPLRLPRRMEADMLKKLTFEQGGCITVGSKDEIRLLSGKRIRFQRYVYRRCISDKLNVRTHARCGTRRNNRICIAVGHLTSTTEIHASRIRAQYAQIEESGARPVSNFSDLPPISSNPKRTFVFGETSTLVTPIIVEFHLSTKRIRPKSIPSPSPIPNPISFVHNQPCWTISNLSGVQSIPEDAP
jgi:hypothetical protein